jgi:hypothetical protein
VGCGQGVFEEAPAGPTIAPTSNATDSTPGSAETKIGQR